MPETDTASSILPVHIEETIQSIAGLNAEHRANATHHQRFVDRITSLLGRASFIAALTTFVVGWVSLNWFAVALGYRALDPPPFAGLAGASSLTSLYLVILILTATAMTFYVKSETADGSLNLIPCFEPRQVFENLEDQRKMGREAWVEDAGRKVLDEMTFKPK